MIVLLISVAYKTGPCGFLATHFRSMIAGNYVMIVKNNIIICLKVEYCTAVSYRLQILRYRVEFQMMGVLGF